jgi:hypothetical protein
MSLAAMMDMASKRGMASKKDTTVTTKEEGHEETTHTITIISLQHLLAQRSATTRPIMVDLEVAMLSNNNPSPNRP